MGSPTQRSLKHLRAEGWDPAIVEKWNPHSRTRTDLWGFADLIAMKPGQPPLLVQATSGANVASRIAKILAEPRARIAADAGFRMEVHGWRRLKSNGGRWTLRLHDIGSGDFPEAA